MIALAMLLALAGCGRKSAPLPPGPPDQVIWPHAYPSP
jgi:predicted small lipoprotein YifL